MTEKPQKPVLIEMFRTYVYPGKEQIRVQNVTRVQDRENGGHAIVSADGLVHFMEPGWLYVYIKPALQSAPPEGKTETKPAAPKPRRTRRKTN